jgi:zinc transport system substrate-binding protein
LDPQLAIEHAESIADALSVRWPEHEGDFRDRMTSLEADLLALDSALVAATASAGSRPIAASHPVYQYLAARYALNLESVQWEPDAPSSASQWNDFQRLLSEHSATLMLWEGEPLGETAERLESLGVTAVVFDQCANVPAEGHYLSVMRRNVESLAAALAEE